MDRRLTPEPHPCPRALGEACGICDAAEQVPADDGRYAWDASPPRGIPPVEGPAFHGQTVDMPGVATRDQALRLARHYDPFRGRHPVDALEPIVRDVAARTGLEVDEAGLSAARAHCDELVPVAHVPRADEVSIGYEIERRGDWIQTVSGRQFWPLDPRPADIDIDDVAHALGMICRFTGHCRRFYSVAEHSVHVLHLVARRLRIRRQASADFLRRAKRRALLHDGPEFVLNDMARPVKYSVEGYREIEALNWSAMCERFDLGPAADPLDKLIKEADRAILLAEQAVLMAPPAAPWAPIEVSPDLLEHAHALLRDVSPFGWGPDRAKWEFLRAYEEIAPMTDGHDQGPDGPRSSTEPGAVQEDGTIMTAGVGGMPGYPVGVGVLWVTLEQAAQAEPYGWRRVPGTDNGELVQVAR